MLFKTLALAAISGLAAAQSAPFPTTNGTATGTPTSSGAVGPTNAAAPAQVANWRYVGCADPPAAVGFPGFTQAYRSDKNTAELCAASCSQNVYFGLSGDACYCGNAIANGTSIEGDAQCSNRCPGDANQACGRAGLLSRRQVATGGQLFSLYQQAVIPAGIIYVDIDIVIFVDVCPTGLTTKTATVYQTLTGCGCANPTKPAVPMTTYVTVCPGCAPESSTVTVTVPATQTGTVVVPVNPGTPGTVVVPGKPGTPGTTIPGQPGVTVPGQPGTPPATVVVPPPAQFTGAAAMKGVSGALALAAGAVAFL